MPVPSSFASKMALHCSFEHFEGDADSRFIREIGRVLRPGGAVCFVPFYVAEDYFFLTDPVVADGSDVKFEAGVTVCGAPGWGNRFGRFYDAAHVGSRLLPHLGELKAQVFRIRNAQEVDPSCYVRFALMLRHPSRT
jgi:SAM-dependent methyltransferase